jgi:hypothetical protein
VPLRINTYGTESDAVGFQLLQAAASPSVTRVTALMPPLPRVNDPKHWYDRAAEIRALSDTMRSEEAVGIMLRLAEDYDRLGDRAAERQKQFADQGNG